MERILFTVYVHVQYSDLQSGDFCQLTLGENDAFHCGVGKTVSIHSRLPLSSIKIHLVTILIDINRWSSKVVL